MMPLPEGLLQAYFVRVEGWRQVRRAFQLKTDRGLVAVKRVACDLRHLPMVMGLVEHLQGLVPVAPWLRTREGAGWWQGEDGCYVATRWIPGRELRPDDPEDVERAIRLMARLHRAATGLGEASRDHLGLWPRRMVERREDLDRLTAVSLEEKRPYAGLLAALWQKQREAVAAALELLAAGDYPALVEAQRAAEGMIHGDFTYHNMIAGDGEVALIDFDFACREIRAWEMARFLGKVLPRHGWSGKLYHRWLEVYDGENPWRQGEELVIAGLLAFPQPLWRLARRYGEDRGPWAEAAFLRELRAYGEDLARQRRFWKGRLG